MGSQSDIEAGRAFITLYAKRDQLKKDLDEAEKDFAGLSKGVANAGNVDFGLSGILANFKLAGPRQEVSLFRTEVENASKSISALRANAAAPIRVSGSVAMTGGAMGGGAMSGVLGQRAQQAGALSTFLFGHDPRGAARRSIDPTRDATLQRALSSGRGTSSSDIPAATRTAWMREPLFGRGSAPGQSAAATAMPAAAAQVAPIRQQMQATATAAATMATRIATPVTASLGLMNRFQLATSNMGSSMMSAGVKIGLAGAAIAAIAIPLNYLTDTFAKSAVAVRDYAKEHHVSIAVALKKTNSELTADQVRLGVALHDSWGKLKDVAKSTWQSVAASIGGAITPILMEKAMTMRGLAAGIKELVKTMGEWVGQNKSLVASLFAGGSVLSAVGIAVVGLGTVISVLGANLAVLGTVAGVIMSPWVLLTAAVIGGAVAWVKYTDSGKAALASFLATVQPFIDIATATITGVKDAIVAGDLGLAWKIALTGMKLAAATAMDSLKGLMSGLMGETISAIIGQVTSGDLSGAWETTTLAMAALWDSFTQGIVTTFAGAADWIVNKWEASVNAIANTLLEIAAGGGLGGKIVSKILGIDVEAEMARSEMIAQQQRAKGIATGPGAMDEAKASIKDQVGSTADAMRAAIQQAREDAELTPATVTALKTKTDAINATADQRIATLNAELAGLTGEAKTKADAVRAKGLPEVDDFAKAGKGPASMVTFSAAAAMAANFGGGSSVEDKAAKQRDKQIKIQEASLAKLDENIRTTQRFVDAMVNA